MAVSREQAILELVLEFGGFLRESEEAQRRYKAAVDAMARATDQADIDRLEREAREAREEIQRLGERGRESLGRLARSSDLAENEVKDLRRETERLDTAIDLAEDELRDFNAQGGRIDRVSSGVRNLRTAFAAVGTIVASIGLARFFRTLIENTNEAEAAQAQIRAAIASTGGAAGATEEELYDMARGLQAVTTFGDDTILGMQSLLLTFTALRKQELPEISERVLDLATALAAGGGGGEIDLRSAAVQVGKALQDPILGITALRRSGISFTDAQQEQIKVLVESNRLYEAQRLILDELAEQVGGRSRAAATTLAGAWEQAKNVAGDLAEEVGTAGLSKELTILARLFTENAGEAAGFAQAVGRAFAFVARQAGAFATGFEVIRGVVANLFGFVLDRGADVVAFVARAMTSVEKLILGALERVRRAIPSLPGAVDDALRAVLGSVRSRLAETQAEAEAGRKGIERELRILADSFKEVAEERFDSARNLAADLARIRKEIEDAGAAAGGPLAVGFEEGEEAATALGEDLGTGADQAERLARGLEAAAAGVDTFAQSQGRLPATRFTADLELDEAALTERLAEVQGRLAELRSGLVIEPAEEHALLAEEASLLIDVSRAQRAWQEAQIDSNRAQAEGVDLSQEHLTVLRDLGLVTDDVAQGLGLSAEALREANVGFRVAGDNLGGLVRDGSEAAQVTLPALDQALLDTARGSGALDESLQGIADRLLVTAGNAEQQGAALAAAGEEGARGQREVAKESRSVAEEIGKSREEAERFRAASEAAFTLWRERGPETTAEVERLAAAITLAATECARLAECSGGGGS